MVTPFNAHATPHLNLEQTFKSSEGFQFSFPSGWVVAYDRSGGQGNGPVAAVGNFQRFLVVSVFRTVNIPKSIITNGLDEPTGRMLCLDAPAASSRTMRFTEISSQATASQLPAVDYYNFEYEIESCNGEIQEGSGGVLRCLGASGQSIPSVRQHHLGRALLSGKSATLLTINASVAADKWADPEVETVMRGIVKSYRIAT